MTTGLLVIIQASSHDIKGSLISSVLIYVGYWQKLSLKSQWFASEAKNGQQHTYANVIFSEDVRDSQPNTFTQNQLSLQLRYRYRFSPLSDIYMVYVRNGSYYQDGENLVGNRDTFNQQFGHPGENLLFFKIRKMF